MSDERTQALDALIVNAGAALAEFNEVAMPLLLDAFQRQGAIIHEAMKGLYPPSP